MESTQADKEEEGNDFKTLLSFKSSESITTKVINNIMPVYAVVFPDHLDRHT